MGALTVGVDVGQRRDPTAVAVIECELVPRDGRLSEVHTVRFLSRLPLGTPYPKVAEAVTKLVRDVRQRALAAAPETQRIGVNAVTGAGTIQRGKIAPTIRIYVDATGVGLPVVDLLRAAGVPVRAVFFTHGDRRVEEPDGTVKLGKAWLVSRLQALLQTDRLKAPENAETRALVGELLSFEIRVDENANDRYGAFKVGAHDDLVTALGLATQDTPPRPFAPAAGGSRPAVAQYEALMPTMERRTGR